MARGQLNMNGAIPLADTSIGTAGTVLGTERADIQGATNANAANKIVKRDGSGNFAAGVITASLAGNASTASLATLANNLATGTTDGDKLHAILAGTATAQIGADVSITANPTSTGALLTLGAGTWLVQGTATLGDGGAANDFVAGIWTVSGSGVTWWAFGQATTAGAGKLVAIPVAAIIVSGGSEQPVIRAYASTTGANAKLKATTNASGASGLVATGITAIRIA